MQGILHRYTSKPCNLQAFESGTVDSGKVVIMLGGLTDGLIACDYVPDINELCTENGYSLIQPILRSSYCQFGTGTLNRDVEDMEELVKWLEQSRSLESICLVGHSTGCQINTLFTKKSPLAAKVKTIVLQAPASDREAFTMEQTPEFISKLMQDSRAAKDKGQSDSIMHVLFGIAPLTAERILDLFDKDGLDDMFSSDLKEKELQERLGHLGRFNTLFCISLADQYVPLGVYPSLGPRLVAAAGDGAHLLQIEGANHSISSEGEGKGKGEFIAKVKQMLQEFM